MTAADQRAAVGTRLRIDDPSLDEWEVTALDHLRAEFLQPPPRIVVDQHLSALREARADFTAVRPAGRAGTASPWRWPVLVAAAAVVVLLVGWLVTAAAQPGVRIVEPAGVPGEAGGGDEESRDGADGDGADGDAESLRGDDSSSRRAPMGPTISDTDRGASFDPDHSGHAPVVPADATGTSEPADGADGRGAGPATSDRRVDDAPDSTGATTVPDDPGPAPTAGTTVPAPTAPEPDPVSTVGGATCDGRAATIVGTNKADELTGTPGADVIVGGNGNDVIRGGGGDDVICGDNGDDSLYGGPGDDVIDGNNGTDVIVPD